MAILIEDHLPVVKYNGLNTNKVVDFSGATSVALPAATTIAGTTAAGTSTITSTSANALTVGRQGATDPVLKINANTSLVATGIEVVGAAAAGGVAVKAISSGTDENLTINAKGAGTVSVNATATGGITLARDVTLGATTGILSGTANGMVPIRYVAVQNAISTATAIGVTAYNTTIDSTSGALALTLAAGTFKGQSRRVQMIVDGGDATLTFNSTSTIVFADVGDVAELVYSGTAWVPVALYNCADGATAPVYTP
jgi:hypothetical protein